MFKRKNNFSFVVLLCSCFFFALTVSGKANAKQSSSGNEISINFKNVDIRILVESVAKITGVNILVDSRVRGRVTLLSSSPVAEDKLFDILKMILSFYGFNAVETEYVTYIVPSQKASSIAPKNKRNKDLYDRVTEILSINNVPVNAMSQILQPFISAQSRIQIVPGSNRMIVSDSRINLNRLKKIIKQIDRVTVSDFDTITLKNAAIETVLKMVRVVFGSSKLLKLEADKRTNRIFVVSNSLETRLAVRAFIAELDIEPELGETKNLGNLKVFYLKYAKSAKIAPIISATLSSEAFSSFLSPSSDRKKRKSSATRKKSTFSIQSDEQLNAIIFTGNSDSLRTAKNIISKLDLPRLQVSIEVIIAEVSNDSVGKFGVNYFSGEKGFATNLDGSLSSIASAFDSEGKTSKEKLGQSMLKSVAEGGISAITGQITSSGILSWGALIRAIEVDSKADILSTPYVVALDNEEAVLRVGEERPVAVGEKFNNTSASDSVFTSVKRKKVGITLKIKPQISNSNELLLNIDSEISSANKGATANNLVTQERRIKTKIRAKSGEIIVMGGLQQKSTTEVEKRIPILGSIPYLGALFRYKSTESYIRNLIIFIRPSIIKTDFDLNYLNYEKYNSFKKLLDIDDSDRFLGGLKEIIGTTFVKPSLTVSGDTEVEDIVVDPAMKPTDKNKKIQTSSSATLLSPVPATVLEDDSEEEN